MKRFMIGMVVLVLVFVGISWASENEDERKAEEYFKSGDNQYINIKASMRYDKGQNIYLRLIYREEKKQTKLMEQILVKLNKGVESK
jgi:ABC-type Na+ efflux pump permease subunit